MRIRIATLTICALLGGGACAEDQAPPTSDARHPGSDRTGIPSGNAFPASQVDGPIHIESTANIPSSDLLVYGPSNIKWGATELLVIRKFSGSSGDGAPGTRPAAGRAALLRQKEHDVAIRPLTTSLALNVKLSTDGVHLNLAF